MIAAEAVTAAAALSSERAKSRSSISCLVRLATVTSVRTSRYQRRAALQRFGWWPRGASAVGVTGILSQARTPGRLLLLFEHERAG
jgi:hypothetical protein